MTDVNPNRWGEPRSHPRGNPSRVGEEVRVENTLKRGLIEFAIGSLALLVGG